MRNKDIAGKRFGCWTAQWPVGRQGKDRFSFSIVWLCLCDCGKLGLIVRSNLGRSSNSCGCLKREICTARIIHGQNRVGKQTTECGMWYSARARAKRLNVPFSISLEEIKIPELCPLLNVPLKIAKGKPLPNSPSLDKLIPELGYVSGNVWVISHRANWIKNNATLSELEMIISGLHKKMDEVTPDATN